MNFVDIDPTVCIFNCCLARLLDQQEHIYKYTLQIPKRMAQSALHRRRGTTQKQTLRYCWDGSSKRAIILIGGMILFLGLIWLGGLSIGITLVIPNRLVESRTTTSMLFGNEIISNGGTVVQDAGKSRILGQRGFLRSQLHHHHHNSNNNNQNELKPTNPTFQEQMKLWIPRDGEDVGMFAAKIDFLMHPISIGGRGPFPYYPNNDRKFRVDKHYNFQTVQLLGGNRYEEYKQGDSPYDFERGESDALARSRRYHVKRAMKFAWSNYQQYAFGMDELLPQTHAGINNWGGFGVTLVDALDTLCLMNMTEEFYEARDWVQSSLDYHKDQDVSVFETTIRSLGGLLSAFDWSGDEAFLRQAQDLGERLSKAFDNETGIPDGQVNLALGKMSGKSKSAIVAEVGTLQLEFRMLSQFTGRLDYKEKSERVYDILLQMARPDGLYPYMIRTNEGSPKFAHDMITFGAMGDSFYEYMLKIWIQGGKTEAKYREMYDKAIQGMHEKLLQVSTPSGLVFIADLNNGKLNTKMDHLVCFMGGLLVLGAYTDPLGLESERAQRDIKTGKVRKLQNIYGLWFGRPQLKENKMLAY